MEGRHCGRYVFFFQQGNTKTSTSGPFLEGPEKFSHPESRNKILNLMITELFYSHILNMNRGSLHTRILRRVNLFVFRYGLIKNDFTYPKSYRDFRETGPSPEPGVLYCHKKCRSLELCDLKRKKCSTGVTEFLLVIIFRPQASGALYSGSQQ